MVGSKVFLLNGLSIIIIIFVGGNLFGIFVFGISEFLLRRIYSRLVWDRKFYVKVEGGKNMFSGNFLI